MAQPSVQGRFIWQELMTSDMADATAFYPKVVGWKVQPPVNAGTDYSVFVADSGSVGGAMPLPEEARKMGARPHWLPYVGAENVDDTLETAERLGGKVLRPASDVENIGRYAVLADPQGAAFGIYRPLHPADSSAKSQPQHGEFAWQELATGDYEAAFSFYSALFGWEALRRMDMGPAGTYLVFGRDGVQQGGIYKLSAQMPEPYWLAYIEVADVDGVIEPARSAGGKVISGPMEVPGGGRIAQLLDPSGVLFAVHAQAAAAAAADSARKPRRRAAKAVKKPPAPAAKVTKKVAKQAGKKATRKASKRVARAAAKKATRKVAKQVARKASKKTIRRPAKGAARKVARKVASRRRGARRAR